MLNGLGEIMPMGEFPDRIPFEKIEDHLNSFFAQLPEDDCGEDISKYTPMEIAKVAFNLQEALYDTRQKIPTGDYGLFRIIEDYGVRELSYGNAAGGTFYGPYKSFLIEYNGSTEFVSFSFSTYYKSSRNDKAKTCMCVAHDNEKETHHALQLVLDDNIHVANDEVTFYHNGRIAIGNIGSGRIDELRKFVEERYPKIIDGKRFNLGTLKNDHLWDIDQPDVTEVIINCIAYALIRDEYRDHVKKQKGKKK